ncbi:O-antigen ligase family protein [Thermoproteota archaeon]
MKAKILAPIKALDLICLFLILALSPILIRLMPSIEPVEEKFLLFNNWSKCLIEAIIVICLLATTTKSLLKKQRLLMCPTLGLPLVGILLISSLSLLYTINSGLTFRAIVDLGSFIILYLIIVNTLTEKDLCKSILSFLIGIAVALSLYGIYQYFFEFKQASGLIDDYIAKNALNTRWDLVKEAISQKRVSSTFGMHNMFASFLGMVIPLSVAMAWQEKEKRTRLIFISAASIMLVAMLLTFSIGGWISLFLALGIEGVLLWKALGLHKHLNQKTKRRMKIILVTCITILVVVASVVIGVKRTNSITRGSFECRRAILTSTLNIIKEHAIIGTGWGTFQDVYLKYLLPGKVNPTKDYATVYAHNLYLQVLVEIGIAGIIAFGIFIVKILIYGFKRIQNLKDDYIRIVSIGIFSGICFFLIHNIVDFGFYFFPVAIFWWFLLGILIVMGRIDSDTAHPEKFLKDKSKKIATIGTLNLVALSLLILVMISRGFLADVHLYHGSTNLNQGRYKKSIEHLKTATRLDPFNSRLREKLGDAHLMHSTKNKSVLVLAEENYLDALKLSVYNPTVYRKLETISYIQGDSKRAERYHEKAIYYFPASEKNDRR